MIFPISLIQNKNTDKKTEIFSHPYYIQWVDDLAKTKSAIDIIYSNFENAVDPDLIDCCIYELNAAQKRYKFLLNCVKKIEMSNWTFHTMQTGN